MSKTVTIRVSDEAYHRLALQAKVEGTTVTALLTEKAMRDPRLDLATAAFQTFADKYGQEFADAFPDEEPAPAQKKRAA